ncbi:MAG TPA: glycosyltransferase family 39 protein, partial [Polymorphobacter sp.]|nr:glycosyltransferase family 39 protein [Polymorphobacter sp.]
ATSLAARWSLYSDFQYLQTPLQPQLFKYFIGIFSGYDFAVLRLLNAVGGIVMLALVCATQRRVGVSATSAAIATLGLAGCVIFQFCVGVARNDVLPGVLLTASMWLLSDIDKRVPAWPVWLVAGCALGLAASAKVTFALPGLALGLWQIWQALHRRAAWIDVAGLAAGGAAGMLPMLIAYHAAPAAFIYGVWTAAAQDTFDWYRSNGLSNLMRQDRKLLLVPLYLVQGPALLALVLVGLNRRGLPANSHYMVAILLGSLVGSVIPSPLWKQYLLMALPPIFVLSGLALDRLNGITLRLVTILMLVAALIASIVNLLAGLQAWQRDGLPSIVRTTAEAHWIGDQVRYRGWNRGEIASFSPSLLLDTGFDIDPRFATAVFVFHSGDRHSDDTLAALHSVTWRTLNGELDRRPPIAIVTGYEGRGGNNRLLVPDAALDRWAESRGYTRSTSPIGAAVLWIGNPARSPAPVP